MTTGATDATGSMAPDHLIALPRILVTWAELIEDQRQDRSSSVAIHARAAAAQLVSLERVALAAVRFLESAAPSADSEAVDHLKDALAAWECCIREQGPAFVAAEATAH